MARLSIRVQAQVQTGLDLKQIIQAALTLLDEVGLDGLTMRRLAERLNIKAASLYWHVRDKEELIALLANEICGEIKQPDPALHWREQFEQFAHDYRRVLLSHRDAARILALSGPPSGENRLNLVEIALSLLLRAGFSQQDAVSISILANDFMTTTVLEESQYSQPPQESEPDENWLNSALQDKYPSIAALADVFNNIDVEAQYRFGIGVLLDGLEKRLTSKK